MLGDAKVTSMCEERPPRSKVGAPPWFTTAKPRELEKSVRASPLGHVDGDPQHEECALKSPATGYDDFTGSLPDAVSQAAEV